MNNLARNFSQEQLIPKGDLDKYVALSKEIKKLEAEKDILNKKIKNALGEFVLDSISEVLKPYQEEVDEYLSAKANVSACTMLGDEEGAGSALVDVMVAAEVLESLGITEDMVNDYVSGDKLRALSHNKTELGISGYTVKTVIQDRSSMNNERAVAYLTNSGRLDLTTTKVVVNEPALEVAIYEGSINAKAFKEACIEEKLVVTLTVK